MYKLRERAFNLSELAGLTEEKKLTTTSDVVDRP